MPVLRVAPQARPRGRVEGREEPEAAGAALAALLLAATDIALAAWWRFF
jgi:hypothetical protein